MRKIILIGLVLLFLVTIVSSADLISIDKPESKISCTNNLCYKEKTEINFNNIAKGFSFNGIEITTENSDGNIILESKDTKVTSKIQFIPKITKDYISDEVEYVWNKKPDDIREHNYFYEPSEFLKYVGGKNDVNEFIKLCPKKEGRCGHGAYTYYTFHWKEEDITLNTKKVDIQTGEVYNIDLTENKLTKEITGFKVTGLNSKTELQANDVVFSGGEIWINERTTCEEFYNYTINHAPECHYLNQSKELAENATMLDLICKVHLNGTLEECVGYHLQFRVDEMPDYLGTIIIHNNSYLNLTQGSISWGFNNKSITRQSYQTFVPAHDEISNHSQYFRNSGLYGLERGKSSTYANITGDKLSMNWFVPSAGYAGTTQTLAPRINGIGTFGITSYGDQMAFPLTIEGKFSINARESANGFCFYVFGPNEGIFQYINISLKDVTCETNGGAIFYSGAFFSFDTITNATFIDIIRINTPDLQLAPFFGTSEVRFLWTPNYIINSSTTDESVNSNITVYTYSDGVFPDMVYNKIGSDWNESILYAYFRTGADLGVGGIERSYYTARMVIKNDSYFTINSSLLISDTTINGKKDMIKIPYAITFNPDSDFNLNI